MKTQKTKNAKEVLSLEETAEFLGLSVRTCWRLAKEDVIPGKQIGNQWRFSRRKLLDFLESGNDD